jgi:hypothetical protein
MRGGSQASLLQVDDGGFYVVKLLDNPQGSGVLLHEALGTELMKIVGLPVPAWSPIEISDHFIDQNPGLWFEIEKGGPKRPPSGIHFGSKLIAGGEIATAYELIPRGWFHRVDNRSDFIGALLFDFWASQSDNRQAIFVQDPDNRSLRAVFIDQGYQFRETPDGRSHWRLPHMYLDPAIYADLDLALFISIWKARIQGFEYERIAALKNDCEIPSEWYTPGTFNRIVDGLIKRQALLDRYSTAAYDALSGFRLGRHDHSRNGRYDDVPVRSPQIRARHH